MDRRLPPKTEPSIGKRAGKMRKELFADGSLLPEGDYLIFTRDVTFTFPSGANSVVLVSNIKGWVS